MGSSADEGQVRPMGSTWPLHLLNLGPSTQFPIYISVLLVKNKKTNHSFHTRPKHT